LDYLLARQVLQTVMDVRALVKDLEQTFSAIQESLLDRCEALSLFIRRNCILYNFVKHRLVVAYLVLALNV
jgi:hypothetical protein